jgi:hypothetical protein
MQQSILNFFGITILSAVLAVATIIGNAMRIDKDPAVDGPRALKAEFFGLWIAFACLAWSFMIAGPGILQWILRGVAACAAIIAFSMAAYFAGTPEVRIRLDEEPTGFENHITALQLNEPLMLSTDSTDVQRQESRWSEFNAQN